MEYASNKNDEPDDWSLAKKLKYEDPVQFHTLVRMHLSFVLDLTDDCDSQPEKTRVKLLKWSFVPFSKKIKQSGKNSEGIQLTRDGISQVHKLIEYLSKEENLVQEGIFRRSGKLTRQQELKAQLSSSVNVKLNDGQYSVHDCASVLKTILAELQEPLLTETYFPAYCQIADLSSHKPNDERLLQALQLLILLLPKENRTVLRDVLQLLHLVASHQQLNKMSPENLATLFTPHLLCPRKLSPEELHSTCQTLSKVVSLMISSGMNLFKIPSLLAMDIKMYWERRKQSPATFLNESSAATTVFSFVDRERTAQENILNPTEAALAQLYAHIQSLPDSSNKRRLVKQFNKDNGHGTPFNVRTKSISNSIKKCIFNKTVKPARGFCDLGQLKKRSSSEELLNSPESKSPKRFQQLKFGKSCDDIQAEVNASPLINKEVNHLSDELLWGTASNEELIAKPLPLSPPFTPSNSPGIGKHPQQQSVSRPPPLTPANRYSTFSLLTSTPACTNCLFTPSPMVGSTEDMSPITLSTQRMSRAMQETMMTPRSRKPVVAVSASNICHLANLTWGLKHNSWSNEQSCGTSGSISEALRDYLSSRSILTASPVDLSFSSRTGDFDPSSEASLDDHKSLPRDEKTPFTPLSESLLYIMDGNVPTGLSSNSSGYGEVKTRKREVEGDDVKRTKRFEQCVTSYSSSGFGMDNSNEIPNETSL